MQRGSLFRTTLSLCELNKKLADNYYALKMMEMGTEIDALSYFYLSIFSIGAVFLSKSCIFFLNPKLNGSFTSPDLLLADNQ